MKTLRWFIIVWVALACLSFILADSQASVDQEVANQAVDTNPPAATVKLIFIHHSCGENWLADYHGGLGLALSNNNYFVSDTNYGWGPEGVGDRTDIGYWWDWFRGPNRDTYLNALYTESNRFGDYYSRLDNDPGGENQIIMFKSCFPNSYLEGSPGDPPTSGDNPMRGQESWSESYTVANAKGIYNDILEYFATRQDKLFIAVTAPPLMDGETDAAHAANARAFNNWLVNEWLAGYPHNNVAVFDFYNVLTSSGGDPYTNDAGQESGNHHRIWNGAVQHIQTVGYDMAAYPDGDSHPSPAGNQKATAEFVPLLNYYYNRWNPGHSAPAPVQEQAPTPSPIPEEEAEPVEVAEEDTTQPEEAQPEAAPVSVEGVIDNLDAGAEYWESYDDGQGSKVDFGLDNDVVYSGTGSLRIQYSIEPNGWGDCGRHFEAVQDWSGGNGLAMWLRADKAGPATFMLFSGDQDSPTPFETVFEIPSESVGDWAEVILPWTVFERAHWADAGGPTEFDPTRVTGLGINFWAESESNEGTLWIDEMSLATGEIQPPPEEEAPAEPAEPTEPPAEPAEPPAEPTEPPAEPTEPETSASAETSAAPIEPTQAVEPAAAPVEEESSGGLCPFSMVMLPLMLVTVVLSRKFTKV
jgi:outer membrane biosynthesis protein TonB